MIGLGLFSTERGKRDLENEMIDRDGRSHQLDDSYTYHQRQTLNKTVIDTHTKSWCEMSINIIGVRVQFISKSNSIPMVQILRFRSHYSIRGVILVSGYN